MHGMGTSFCQGSTDDVWCEEMGGVRTPKGEQVTAGDNNLVPLT